MIYRPWPHDGDDAAAVATSPDGQTVFVTGGSTGTGAFSVSQYATIAYQAGTGTQLWVRRYDNPGGTQDQAVSVVVSPDGGLVFVTGLTSGAGAGAIATVAYRAATGAFQWATVYHAPHGEDVSSMAVSPDGTTVFITGVGYRNDAGSKSDYLTIAYRAATGTQLWIRRYHGHGGFNAAASVAVSPSGRTVFVTGASNQGRKGSLNSDYATVAYRAATGARLWVRRYNGPGNRDDEAASVAVSPGGRTVFVTGDSVGVRSREDYATVAYRAATGARVWARHYQNGSADEAGAVSVAVSPAGLVFVTGTSQRRGGDNDYATIAYRG